MISTNQLTGNYMNTLIMLGFVLFWLAFMRPVFLGAISFSFFNDGLLEKIYTVLVWAYIIGAPVVDFFKYF